jgi:hypothetical protein
VDNHDGRIDLWCLTFYFVVRLLIAGEDSFPTL